MLFYSGDWTSVRYEFRCFSFIFMDDRYILKEGVNVGLDFCFSRLLFLERFFGFYYVVGFRGDFRKVFW